MVLSINICNNCLYYFQKFSLDVCKVLSLGFVTPRDTVDDERVCASMRTGLWSILRMNLYIDTDRQEG